MIEKLAVRLEGLPWKWVRADKLGLTAQQLKEFVAISKDAPDTLALALETEEGYEFANVDFYEVIAFPTGRLQIPELERKITLDEIYVPLGFAKDVEGWLGQWPDQDPEGEWVDFCDLTRTTEEGGDGDRYFAAHFVGPSWWVVPFPE